MADLLHASPSQVGGTSIVMMDDESLGDASEGITVR